MSEQKKAAVIMGSDSDFPTVSGAIKTLNSFGVPFEVRIMSAHRTPEEAAAFAASARENGFGVIIAAAGKAAHLAGVLAAHTTIPVIGIPIKSSTLDGLDALLATVQMPKGIPVATVAIDIIPIAIDDPKTKGHGISSVTGLLGGESIFIEAVSTSLLNLGER